MIACSESEEFVDTLVAKAARLLKAHPIVIIDGRPQPTTPMAAANLVANMRRAPYSALVITIACRLEQDPSVQHVLRDRRALAHQFAA